MHARLRNAHRYLHIMLFFVVGKEIESNIVFPKQTQKGQGSGIIVSG
jgi:hypothetical protein